MRKLLITVAAILGFLFVGTGAGQAESAIRLFLDSKELQAEVPPRIMNNSTMVPVRIISEELGAKVSWSSSDKKVTVEKNGLMMQLFIDKTDAYVNGTRSRLETAPVLKDGNTLLPVRFISETLGLLVSWDGLTRSVSLYHTGDSLNKHELQTSPTVPSGATPAPIPVSATPLPTPTPTASSKPSAAASVIPSPTPSPTSSASSMPTVKASATPSLGQTAIPASSSTPKPSGSAKPAPLPSGAAGQSSSDSSGSGMPEVQQIIMDGDVLRIKASGGTLQPKFTSLSNPLRLIIDLPLSALGKTINGKPAVQNGEITADHPAISKIRYALYQDNPSTVRIVVDLNQKIAYNLLESNNPGELAISLKAITYRVVLDAGHGGTDSGAISVKGRYEKDFNLSVVLQIAKLLEAEAMIDVQMTRSEDTTVELNDRAPFANNFEADVFVSVHANNFKTNPSVKGVETYYTREDSASLAAILHENILTATGSNDRRVRTADFRVTKFTAMPAVLCEIGYLSNAQEEEQLFNEEVQARVAASIASGIKEYLQIP
jgi:N-acetylmuramoyl-L-alanine amidase